MREFDVEERRATWLELFFDLCFVAAVAALAEGLTRDPTGSGLWRFVALFVPVWWGWMAFTWFSTAWDNDDLLHRFGMLAAMLLVVVLAAAIPRIERGNDRVFVLTYAAMHFLLAALFLRVLPHAGPARRFARNYLIGEAVGGALWLSSLAFPQGVRPWIWTIAMTELLVAPVFAVRAYPEQPYDSSHIPERYGLFTIIVLGEGIVRVAAALSGPDVQLNGEAIAAAMLGFAIAAAIWWIYFGTVSSAGLSRERLGAAFVWGYGQLAAFTGIAATAVGVELAIVAAATDTRLPLVPRLLLTAGPAAFFLAVAVIHRVTVDRWDAVITQRTLTILLLVVVGVLAEGTRPEVLTAAVAATMLLTTTLDVRRAGHMGLAADPDREI
jgi:low temperature requirement protein LtrA